MAIGAINGINNYCFKAETKPNDNKTESKPQQKTEEKQDKKQPEYVRTDSYKKIFAALSGAMGIFSGLSAASGMSAGTKAVKAVCHGALGAITGAVCGAFADFSINTIVQNTVKSLKQTNTECKEEKCDNK